MTPPKCFSATTQGSAAAAQHENAGIIGINGNGIEAGYKVEAGTPIARRGTTNLLKVHRVES
ncbi:MAG: hypothetical protein DMG21_18360 [Acidobacteria bacterium]|nr:MAG: hypothetical protein DMG21_18360 [Acidobacteriota bacterium]